MTLMRLLSQVIESDRILVAKRAITGGFGAAKNLSDWALKGPDCTVDPTVEKVIKSFHAAKKPMGFCCIAPHLAAKVSLVFGDHN